MNNQKDELISGVELARRLGVKPPYITKVKKEGKLKRCFKGTKYYFRKSCLALGYNHDNLTKSKELPKSTDKTILVENKTIQKETKKEEKTTPKTQLPKKNTENRDFKSDIETLYDEILTSIADPDTTRDKLTLDGLNLKAKALKEFELATAQRLKNKQLEENLYSKDEVLNIITVSVAIFRNALIDLPNNFASTLEGLNKKQIKDTSSEIINDILEEFEKTSEQFN
jgi:hypothetical protein